MMKFSKKHTLLILLSFVFLQGCLLDLRENNFESFYFYLVNNSGKPDCNKDSVNVIFLIQNLSKASSDKVFIDVPAGETKSAKIEGTKDETIKVKLLNAADSTIIIEKEIKIGKTVYQNGGKSGDVVSRRISYCTNSALVLEAFGD